MFLTNRGIVNEHNGSTGKTGSSIHKVSLNIKLALKAIAEQENLVRIFWDPLT